MTFNITGSLLLQLEQLKAYEFFDLVKELIGEKKIEIITSALYHPLIPITPKDVVARQIENNSEVLRRLLGVQEVLGFFPPELAVNSEYLKLIDGRYIVVDETALKYRGKMRNALVLYEGKYLLLNNRHVCDLLRGYPALLTAERVMNLIQKNCDEKGLLITANDAELFGHHYAERLEVLSDLLDTNEITYLKVSEAVTLFRKSVPVVSKVFDSTWQDSRGFRLWNANVLQKKYLHLLQMVYELTHHHLDHEAEDFLDQAYSSCYLYWLSNWPWWHPDFVGKGAQSLIKSVRIANIDPKKKMLAEADYHQFLQAVWQYHWSGRVEKNYQKFTQTKKKFSGV